MVHIEVAAGSDADGEAEAVQSSVGSVPTATPPSPVIGRPTLTGRGKRGKTKIQAKPMSDVLHDLLIESQKVQKEAMKMSREVNI